MHGAVRPSLLERFFAKYEFTCHLAMSDQMGNLCLHVRCSLRLWAGIVSFFDGA